MSASMKTPADPALSKGMAMIAAYRERPCAAGPGKAEPSLAEIGFGPGMRIRLGHLGLHSVGDLAGADAARLRLALGDISRLIDVEAWISSARQMVRTMSGKK